MALDPKTLIHRWFNEVWNQGREETIDELCAPEAIGHGLGEGDADTHGPAGFRIFLHNMRTAFPDVHFTIEDTIVQGDKAVVRLIFKGTHIGDGLGLPPTGNSVTLAGIVIVRVAAGQITEAWNSWDQLGLLRQIGAVPAPGADRFLEARA